MYGPASQLANASTNKRPATGDLGASRKTTPGASTNLQANAEQGESSGEETILEKGSAGSAPAVAAGETAKSPAAGAGRGQVPLSNLTASIAVAGAGTGPPTGPSIFLQDEYKTPEKPVFHVQHLNNSVVLAKNGGKANNIVNEIAIETRFFFNYKGIEILSHMDFFQEDSWMLRPFIANLDLGVNGGMSLKGFDRDYVHLMNPYQMMDGPFCWATSFDNVVKCFTSGSSL